MTQGTTPVDQILTGKLREGLRSVAKAAVDRLSDAASQRMGRLTDQLNAYVAGDKGAAGEALSAGAQKLMKGGSPGGAAVSAGLAGGKKAVTGLFGGKGGEQQEGEGGIPRRRNDPKVTNIIEEIDVGVPVELAYNQWTEFKNFPHFMKKVEDIEQKSDEKLTWKAQVMWSHRTWESTIIEQVPDERIVWRSRGAKGSVDGTVTFHELAPDLTRILVVLEYHPQGFVEKTANLWRAQGRRVRLELKHFVRKVMTETVLDPDQVNGWRGEIRDGQVVSDGERADEGKESAEPAAAQQPEQEQPKPRRQPAPAARGR